MNSMPFALIDWLLPEFAARLAAVLLHSLWQASLLAAGLWVVLRCLNGARPQTRYRCSLAALAMVMIMPALTWSLLGRQPSTSALAPDIAIGEAEARATNIRPSAFDSPAAPDVAWQDNARGAQPAEKSPAQFRAAADEKAGAFGLWPFAVVAFWFAGMLVMLARVVLAVRAGRRLVRSATPLDLPALNDMLEDVRRRLGLWRRVQVKACEAVSVPAVLGALWPVLLVPPSFLSGLPVEHLRVVLAHELAHIRRYDYLINLGQLLIEAALFFNPAMWWISRRIRIEREACCDALAVLLSGEPIVVARSLVEWAESARTEALQAAANHAAWRPWSVTAQAYDGRSGQGTLWERVRRIVTPGEVPRVRLPWYSLAGLLIGGGALLVGLERGGEVVIEAADRWLSPEQRIEKLEQIERDYAQPQERPKVPPPAFRIAGAVRTADGSPLPEKLNLYAAVLSPGYTGADDAAIDENGRFSKEFKAERVYLHLRAPGWATTFAGPFDAADGDFGNVALTLDRGFSTRIRFVNENGEGTPGVALEKLHYNLPSRDGKSAAGYHHPQQDAHLASDAQGYVTLSGCSDWPITIDVRGGEYQFERREQRLQPDATLNWSLKHARQVTGRVVDGQTGKPIAGAEFYLVRREGYADTTQDPRDPMAASIVLATSDEAGRFALDTLRDDCEYAVLVRARQHAVKLIEELRPGTRDLEVRLGPALYVRGQILGKFDQLPRDHVTQAPYVDYRNPLRLRNTGYNMILHGAVRMEDEAARFELTDLFPGPVTLMLPDRTVSLDVTGSIDDYTIDLNAPPQPAVSFENLPQREVVLRFKAPPGLPPARGQVRIGFQLPPVEGGHSNREFRDQIFQLKGDELRFRAPTGTTMFCDTRKVVGYRIEKNPHIEVTAADEPLEIAFELLPAGGIFGQVLNWDDKPASNCSIHLLMVEKPPKHDSPLFESVDVKNADGRFALGQLPLGGRYRVLAVDHHSEARALSPIMTIDEQSPLENVELRFIKGVSFAVKVLGPDGKPAAGIPLHLEYTSPHNQSMGRGNKATGADGRFVFEHLDPTLPGHYSLAIRPGANLCGAWISSIDPTQPLTVRLQRGTQLRGILLDAATSQPIADARILLLPALENATRPRYLGLIEARTDAAGQFEFHNLEPVAYQLRVEGASEVKIAAPADAPNDQRGEAIVRAGKVAKVTVMATRAQ